MVSSRGVERLESSRVVKRLKRFLSVVPSASRSPVILYVLVTDGHNVAGVISVAAVPAVVSSCPGSAVTIRTARIVALTSTSSTWIEAGAEVSINNRVLGEVV